MAPEQMPDWMVSMMQRWLHDFDLGDDLPNCVNLNLYQDGSHTVGWHADDEPLFQGTTQDTRIISVTLGQARKFRAGMQDPNGKKLAPAKGTISDVMLGHGDICTMEGLFQKHFLHQVATQRSIKDAPRINATFRWIVKHGRTCPLHAPGETDSESSASEDSGTASEGGPKPLRSARGIRRGLRRRAGVGPIIRVARRRKPKQ